LTIKFNYTEGGKECSGQGLDMMPNLNKKNYRILDVLIRSPPKVFNKAHVTVTTSTILRHSLRSPKRLAYK